MALRLITADERLAERNLKVTMAIFGQWGVGKTSLLHTLDPDTTLFLNFEAGDKSVQTHTAHEFKIRSFQDARDLACLLGGANPALREADAYSSAHFEHVKNVYAEIDSARYRTIFVDSITDLSRIAMQWAQQQPDAINQQGKPDTRGAYGLLGREVIALLKHLQHAPGKNVIFVGVLEEVKDDFGRSSWQPQMEGGKIARELPGIVDQVVTMGFFDFDANAAEGSQRWQHAPGKGEHRVLVCKSPNPWSLLAKDRSGNLQLIEEPNLGKLIDKINLPARTAAERLVIATPQANSAAA